jgi:predicted DCC family thiol-disulfide oxidoreductase YuxK
VAVKVFYDGDCPFCAGYLRLARLRDAAGAVDLVDLRRDPDARQRFAGLGLDPDRGMIVETEGGRFHGPAAMAALSAMSGRNRALARLAATLMATPVLAPALYALLRAGRNLTLLALGRPPLGEGDRGEAALFAIFARFLGLFSVMHVFIYVFRYTSLETQPTTLPLLLLGLALTVAPGDRRLFVGTLLALALDGWLHAPVHSSHTILKNFLVAAMIGGGLWHWLRGSAWEAFFRDVRPVGRSLLLIMYAFGIFHKINTGFLDPATSCAVALWRMMPAPLSWIDTPAMHALAIYGTFAVEGLIMLLLVVPRWRHWGIASGIGFHSLLALSGYAMYPVFSTLAIVLHSLYIAPAAALRITRSAEYRRLERRLHSPAGIAFLTAALLLVVTLALLRDYSSLALAWLLLVLWPLAIVVRHGAEEEGEGGLRCFWSRLAPLNAVTLLFFVNCASPYLGLKTAQTMNMFSNLRLEGGVSNHLLLPPPAFGYLSDLVIVTAADGSRPLEWAAARGDVAFVRYHFLALLEAAPDTRVSYTRNGAAHDDRLAADILEAEGDLLHAPWIRKLFHFRPVLLAEPPPCE